MRRTALTLAFALAAAILAGCGESDPNKTNNSIPQTGVAPGPGGGPIQGATDRPPGADYPKGEPAQPTGSGAGKTGDAGNAADPGKSSEPAKGDDAGKADPNPKVANVTLSEAEIAEIRKLPSKADQEAALAQKVCPISGDHLGDEAMGVPIKVTAGGKTAFLCCKGCKGDFEKDPTAALAKLGLSK